MKRVAAIAVLGAALAVQSCNPAEEQASKTAPKGESTAAPGGAMGNMPMPGQTGQTAQGTTYTTMGEVASVAGDSVTINHQPVPALGWPAMTMTFKAPDAAMTVGLQKGAAVEFSFREQGNEHVLTEIKPR
jgi:membrane fusion protein, copper/silver efflux system